MAEPEEVLIDAGRHAASAVGRMWRRHQAGREIVEADEWLDEQRGRLRLLITAVHDVELPIRTAQPPAPPTLLARLMRPLPRVLRLTIALPATDGQHLFLPRRIAGFGELQPGRWYRLLALQQAGRALRGSALSGVPPDDITAELYRIAEAAATDRAIARDLPGLIPDMMLQRAAMLADRPPLSVMTERERVIEGIYRDVLARAPEDTGMVPHMPTAAQSLSWATQIAQQVVAGTRGAFRTIRGDFWLGQFRQPPPARHELAEDAGQQDQTAEQSRSKTAQLARRPEAREAAEDEDDTEPGMWMLQMDDPQEHVEDAMGLDRPADRDTGEKPEEMADSLSELPEARLVATPERAREIFASDDPPDARAFVTPASQPDGIAYPEWDYRISAYLAPGATVRLRTCAMGDPQWADRVTERRRRLLEDVRRRFAGLRPRRMQFNRQRDGDEVDIDAWVEAAADRRAGRAIEDRLYLATRAGRRNVAISLLIDISGSTDAWVEGDLRIIDVAKEALFICCHALDALGDPYAIQAFSGEGPHGVDLWPIKTFSALDQMVVHRRIAALEPEHNTRAGAAMRHATAELAQRAEQHRLLLLLSDGKPNDIDLYEGRYGVEDMRQAVIEAAAAGVHCFCLTIDRQAPSYLDRIFGPGHHRILRHTGQLPLALVDLLRQLLQSNS